MKNRKWSPIKDGKLDLESAMEPTRWRAKAIVQMDGDIFTLKHVEIDFLFAVMASCGNFNFNLRTRKGKRGLRYLDKLAERGKKAQDRYVSWIRNHFKRNKKKFVEGYTLPELPTAELRAIYDSARRTQTGEKTLGGKPFSGGETHWRDWPLDNVIIRGLNPS